MSKNLFNNERKLKELANKHKPVPPPMVWDEIEKVLDKDDHKRRRFPMLWIFGFLLVGAILFIYLRGEDNKKSSLVEQEIIIIDHQKQSDLKPEDIKTDSSVVIDKVSQEQNANISTVIAPVTDKQKTVKVDTEKPKTFLAQQAQLNNLNTSTVDKSLINTSAVDKSLKANTNTTNSTVPASTSFGEGEDINIAKVFAPSTHEELPLLPVIDLLRLKWIEISYEDSMAILDLKENWTIVTNNKYKTKRSLNSPWFVDLSGGLGRNVSDPVLIDPTQGAFRLNTESKWYSWSTSFQLGYQFDNHWYTAIGLDLNQTKTKFDFWRGDVTSLVNDGSQNIQFKKGDLLNIGEIRHTFADVGLSIGKRVNINKLHFSFESGPIFNVLFNANGKLQVGEVKFSRQEQQEEYHKTRIGIGGRLSASLDYPISDHLWISVGPNYHQYFNTLSSDANPLEERNAILQVKARVRHHF